MPIRAWPAERDPDRVLFTVADRTLWLERRAFLLQLAEHALWFYDWHRRVTADPKSTYRADAERLRAAAQAP